MQTDLSEEGSIDIESVNTDSPDEIFDATELQSIITSTLNQLGEETKTALTLREFEGLSYEQIAEVVNCPVGTVRSRIFRGREVIADAIREFKLGIVKQKLEVRS